MVIRLIVENVCFRLAGTSSAWEAEALPLDDTCKMLGFGILQSDGVTSHGRVVEEWCWIILDLNMNSSRVCR